MLMGRYVGGYYVGGSIELFAHKFSVLMRHKGAEKGMNSKLVQMSQIVTSLLFPRTAGKTKNLHNTLSNNLGTQKICIF